jgi:RNA polymerase sigma-70 factor, ECF subfamily
MSSVATVRPPGAFHRKRRGLRPSPQMRQVQCSGVVCMVRKPTAWSSESKTCAHSPASSPHYRSSADVATSEFGSVLAAAQEGAQWAITVLWREHHPALVRFLRGLDPSAAEDIEADTWLVAARDLNRFRGDEHQFRAWMFTIARNRLIDWRRREARRPSIATATEILGKHPAEDDPAVTVVEVLGTDAAVALVRACLPRDQAEVILLRVLGGLDVDEVAAIVGKRPGNVRVLQHRGLRRLAERMSDEAPERRGVTP